ncbi:hypothetical protein GGI43DRAFT_396528 [Trichoderma evansii]
MSGRLVLMRGLTRFCRNSQRRHRANRLLPLSTQRTLEDGLSGLEDGQSSVVEVSARAHSAHTVEATTSSWSEWAEPRQHRLLRSHLSPPQGES